MNEPKRRGRPPKAIPAIEQPPMIALPVVHLPSTATEIKAACLSSVMADAAQAYANRVWSGQSPDAPRAWRIERVKLALEGQSLPFEGVVLP